MSRILKTLFLLLAFVFTTSNIQSCKSKGAYNEFRNAKTRPSERQARADKKVIARTNKNYKKQMRSNRKRLFGSKRDPGAPKK
ncbi:hypothetical protein BH10BAC1_BH10BAC1_11230 [soil metagenome]